MSETRIKFSNIVKNQLPTYVENEFPLISEFLKQYYISQEYKSGSTDLIQNIDQYVKLDEQTSLNYEVNLIEDTDEFATTINIDLSLNQRGTELFPDSYGLLKINDEVITYTGKTDSSFTGCIRGFNGVTSYQSDLNQGDLVFSSTEAADHKKGDVVENLSCLFLKEFLKKTKVQFLPGLNERPLSSNLNQNLFIKQSKDFYTSKGTDQAHKILFKALYGVDVEVVKPRDYLFTPSNSNNLVTSNFLVESITGDPESLESKTIFQGTSGETYTPLYSVEKINTGIGKTYYKLAFDSGYNRDSSVLGATRGSFKISPKTHIIGNVSSGSTVIDVDSTIGFPNSGELGVKYPNSTNSNTGIVSYTSKTVTQFLGCTNIVDTIIDGDTLNTLDYAYTKPDSEIQVRIGSVLSNFSKQDGIFDYKPGDKFQIKTLGIENESFRFKNWLYNNSVKYSISKIELIDNISPKVYKLTLKTENYLRLGDNLTITSPNSIDSFDAVVSDIISAKVITVKTTATLDIKLGYSICKKIKKVTSDYFPGVGKFQSNIQNVYKKKYSNSALIATNSLPSYKTQPLTVDRKRITFSGTFSGSIFNINNHGYYSGESIYYTPQKTTKSVELDGEISEETTVISSLFGGDTGGEGVYYILRVDNDNIKLAKSNANLYASQFVSTENSTTVVDNIIEDSILAGKQLEPQKLYREISNPINNDLLIETKPGSTGILINGVEILNYKSNNLIHYGKLEEVEVSSPGSGFDIINPPILSIKDPVGSGATGYLAVSGNLRNIQIIDRGFDFTEVPIVSITGGNGSNAKASAVTKLISHSVEFFSDPSSARVSLGASLSTIGFSTYHKFRDGEQVVYKTNSQKGVGGLSTDATYFASIVDATTIKLHNNIGDSVVGINTVTLSFFGEGKHILECTSKKAVIDSINVVNSGSGYENKKRSVISAGINTASNTVTIENHDYNSGEVIRYSTGSSSIGGLVDGKDYYVTSIDNNQFRLSEIGTINDKDLFYRTNQYVELESSGSGTHHFNYPPILVSVKGPVGISTVAGIESKDFQSIVQPIFTGEVTSVHLSNKGFGYGTNDIINLNKPPQVSIISGANAQAQPIVSSAGEIIEVLVENVGSKYTSIPTVELLSDSGIGCVLTPIFENGLLKEIIVVEPGIGYVSGQTEILISPTEEDVNFIPKLQTWRINLFDKLYNTNRIKDDDLVLGESSSKKYGLQCYSLYAPRELRQMVYSIAQGGETLYGKTDLKLVNSQETEFTDHSPILGWAYDGNPIYGPYGYSGVDGGVVTLMKSSYRLNQTRPSGPPTSVYPIGTFVEDFTYYELDDDSFLDQNNGRYCITPDFPNGTYAYFTTINENSNESSGVFKNYRIPKFPYTIGKNYNSTPIDFNFKVSSNQDEYQIEDNDWCRNTVSYNLREDGLDYPYIYLPDNLSQTGEIVSTNRGELQRVDIKTPGDNYRIGDTLNISNGGTTGFGAAGRVAILKGKKVNSLNASITKLSGVDIFPSSKKGTYFVQSTSPHNLKPLDIVSVGAVSTTTSKIEGKYSIGVLNESFSLTGIGTIGVAIGSTSVTGIVTFFNISSNLIGSNIVPNDILGIGTERVKVLNIDKNNSRFRVLRSVDGTVGGIHTIGSIISEDPRRLTINSGFKTTFNFKRNTEVYFEPSETVGLGTIAVGLGTVLTFSSFGLNTVGLGTTSGSSTLNVPLKSLYVKNHNLQTGDILTYSSNGGSGIVYNEVGRVGIDTTLSDGQQVFVAKISNDLIGIATQKVGLGSTGGFVGVGNSSSTIFFTGLGSGNNHSFKTNYEQITGDISKRSVTVVTDVNHGVTSVHKVDIDVDPKFTETYTVKYNDANRRVLVGIQTFSAIGINSSTNNINITNHGYESGNKVIHTSTAPCGGLENDKIYYIVKVDNDNVKLSNTHYSSVSLAPSIVGISSTSFGEFGLVNPPINAYRTSTLNFDMSDSSLAYTQQSTQYPAFKLNFYLDDKYTKIWKTDETSGTFNVSRTGKSGLSTTSKVTVSIGRTSPDRIYYRLDPIFNSNIPNEKSEIVVDKTVFNNNSIISTNSVYNGQRQISIAGTNFFTFSLYENPESNSYVSTSSSITYTTDCTHTSGPISRVEVTSSGKNYNSLPEIISVNSVEGTGAELVSVSNNIGIIEKVKLNDIGYDFPTDNTLKPSASLPQIISVDSYAKIDNINIISIGKGYSYAPDLIAFDGKTGKQIVDLSIGYSLGDSNVSIFNNTKGINNSVPKILPINNNNGVGISTVGFNTITKDVTVKMSVGFSTNFPFAVGDSVLIENISIGAGSTGKGFNSKDYGYKLFTLTNVTENIGGIGSVAYNLSNDLENGEIPGTMDLINSSGMITPEKFFPSFEVSLVTGDYLPGEKVTSNINGNQIEGIAQSWDKTTKTLRILSNDNFKTGEKLRGLTSNLIGVASTVTSYESYFDTDVSSLIFSGSQLDSGFLNDNLQRLPDNNYYQKFSYALRSTIAFDDWNDVISSLNHTIGYKKFGDLQVETSNGSQPLTVGLTTGLTDVSIVSDLHGVIDTNCVFDFDIATENNLNFTNETNGILSNEVFFNKKILTDFTESVGNRVLSIDDISPLFNSNPRSTAFTTVGTFKLSDIRFRKYFTYLRDKRFTQERQSLIVDLIHDGIFGYINQYARIESVYDQGSFDFAISGDEGELRFFPTKSSVNDYDITAISYNLNDNYLSTGSTSIGGVLIDSESVIINSGVSTPIVSVGNTYHSLKVLVEITPDVSNPSFGSTATFNSNEFEAQELNIVHDGSNVSILEYGKLTTSSGSYSATGFGTYTAYLSGSNIKLDFNPSAGIGTNAVVNTIVVGLSSVSSGNSTLDMKHARLQSRTTNITSSGSPTENVISEYPSQSGTQVDRYDSAYCMIQVHDTTNNRYEFLEYIVVDDHIEGETVSDTFDTEFANIQTHSGLGTFGSKVITNSVGLAATTQVLFTPVSGINATVHVYMNAVRIEDDSKDIISLSNGTIETGYGSYTGTDRDIKRSFDLTHKNSNIFERTFTGDNSSIVNLIDNPITIPNHFYVSGEKIEYFCPGIGITQSIGIAQTTFPTTGVTTTLLPQTGLFVVKVNDNTINLSRSAEDALKSIPKVLDLTSVGVGAAHTFTSTNQNPKVLVAIDNLIQSPIVSTAVTTTLAKQVVTTDENVKFAGITSFFGGDLVKIGDEIMKIEGVGIGSTNTIKVRRGWMGTNILSGLSTGDLVTKIVGNYNIVKNTLNFSEAPFGNTPIGTSTNPPDERDYVGITTSSSFQGRTFQRSAAKNTSNETYYKNYIFDDISNNFNSLDREFTLKSNGSNITGIHNEGAIILINDIFQTPGDLNNYTLSENTGISSISFVGSARTVTSDVGISSFPKGGMIVSVGSTAGFGYQPLVSAGGTAIISGLGTISSISIGNSGSGYRSGIQTVNVSVGTSSVFGSNLVKVGIASINNGNIVSIAITNPGTGYTTTNLPFVVIDDPLSYSNIPLAYTSGITGFGTNATISVVVGQGSSVIDFEIKNTGYGYGNGETLTVEFGGISGIPTTTAFTPSNQFEIEVEKVIKDEFTGWSLGVIETLDDVSNYIDGTRIDFPLLRSGIPISILKSKGSKIELDQLLLVFVNGILQIPGSSYTFDGGTQIRFTEPLKIGDTLKINFYKGSGDDLDIIDREVIETIKYGDSVQLNYDPDRNQKSYLQENLRTISTISSVNSSKTLPYFGPGTTRDTTLERPITWCRQTEDKIINGQEVGKDREIYEPVINPTANIINNVSIGSTTIYVDRLRPLFDLNNENADSNVRETYRKQITLLSPETTVGASATAVVSIAGTIASIPISNGGVGYSTAPDVSVGIGSVTATATSTITNGVVTGITIINPGSGYTQTNPPLVLIGPPAKQTETNDVLNSQYSGDSGVIVGLGTTSVGVGSTGMMFHLHIPFTSEMRNAKLVGTATTLSGISTGDYFIVRNSNLGAATTSITSFGTDNSTIVGIGAEFIDNVYVVNSSELITQNISGISTTVVKVTVNTNVNPNGISGLSTAAFLGEYSWGKVILNGRTKEFSYPANTLSGIGTNELTGISTSSKLYRTKYIRFKKFT